MTEFSFLGELSFIQSPVKLYYYHILDSALDWQFGQLAFFQIAIEILSIGWRPHWSELMKNKILFVDNFSQTDQKDKQTKKCNPIFDNNSV